VFGAVIAAVGHGGGGRGHHDTFFPPLASSASSILRNKSMKSSGTGSCATSSYMRRSSRPMARCRARMARVFSLGFSSFDTVVSHCCVIFEPAPDTGFTEGKLRNHLGSCPAGFTPLKVQTSPFQNG